MVSGIPQLESFFRSERDKEPQPEIHLRPDRRSRYETTALVMAAAQRNRMKKMGFVNTADFRTSQAAETFGKLSAVPSIQFARMP